MKKESNKRTSHRLLEQAFENYQQWNQTYQPLQIVAKRLL